MRIALSPVRRKRLSMTSLIDVIFLLLLFFMLTSVFSEHVRIEVDSGAVSQGVLTGPPAGILSVGAASLYLNGEPLEEEALRAAAAAMAMRKNGALLVSVSAGTDAQRLSEILLLLDGIDGLSVLLAR